MEFFHGPKAGLSLHRLVAGLSESGDCRFSSIRKHEIHIDGVATVYQNPGRKKVGEFTLNKTFAWGGIYGASVTMDTIEDTYAEAVAEAVTQGK